MTRQILLAKASELVAGLLSTRGWRFIEPQPLAGWLSFTRGKRLFIIPFGQRSTAWFQKRAWGIYFPSLRRACLWNRCFISAQLNRLTLRRVPYHFRCEQRKHAM